MPDWTIVGGGIHGVHLALCLLARGVQHDRLAIVDADAQPLAQWRKAARAVGMPHLRSPAMHHVDVDPHSLMRFAVENDYSATRGDLVPSYGRPSLALFEAHANAVVERAKLQACWRQAQVDRLVLRDDGVVVETSQGAFATRLAVLALGATRWPHVPEWAAPLRAEPQTAYRVRHVFDATFDIEAAAAADAAIAVVGGGMSAVQTALALSARRPADRLRLVMRHRVRVRDFDTDPGWLGPRELDHFATLDGPSRAAVVHAARHRGTIPAEVAEALRVAVHAGRVEVVRDEVINAAIDDGELVLHTRDRVLAVGQVVLATGSARSPLAPPLIRRLADEAGLLVTPTGHARVDARLRWHPRIHVMGEPVALEVGPVAGNIAGARMAAARIVQGGTV